MVFEVLVVWPRQCAWRHRRRNTWTNAFFAVGFGFKHHEALVFTSFKKGPWKGASNFGLVNESMEQYFRTQSWRCPMFGVCYPLICKENTIGSSQRDMELQLTCRRFGTRSIRALGSTVRQQ